MSFGEMFFLVFLALIVFGPKRLPEMARKLGKIIGEFRRASNEFRAQIEDEVRKLELDKAAKSIQAELKQTTQSVSRVPLDQQILPPKSTTQGRDSSFDTGFSANNSTAPLTTTPEGTSSQHA
jgi:sec-independent protein translocase protein TatB